MDFKNLKNNKENILKAEICAYFFNLEKTFKWWFFWNLNVSHKQLKDNILNEFSEINKFINSNNGFKSIFYWKQGNSNQYNKILINGVEKPFSTTEKWQVACKKQDNNIIKSNIFGKKVNSNVLFEYFDENNIKDIYFFQQCNKEFWKYNIWKISLEKLRDNIFLLVKEKTQNILSDDRIWLSEVTLWDQIYNVVTWFKTQLMCYQNNLINNNNWFRNIKWKVVWLQYDKLKFIERSWKAEKSLKTIISRKEEIKEFDEFVKEYLEKDLAVANEIYRDETGIYFLFSESFDDNFIKENSENKESIYNDLINEFIDKWFAFYWENEWKNIAKLFLLESWLKIKIWKPVRIVLNIWEMLDDFNKNKEKDSYNIRFLNDYLKDIEVKEWDWLCKNCWIIVFNNKIKNDNDYKWFCSYCENRIKYIEINNFLDKENETKEINEIKDNNNRISLITVKFETEKWFNYENLLTLLEEDFENDFNDIVEELKNNNFNDKEDFECILKNGFKNRNYHNDINFFKFDNYCKEFLLKNESIKKHFEQENWYDSSNFVWDWQKLSQSNKLEDFIKLVVTIIFTKNWSPERFHRIWNSLEQYHEEVDNYLSSNLSNQYRTILKSPVSYQFIVPADKTTQVIKEIKSLYEKHFGLVKWKLPMHIGIIIQNYKFPLYLGIRALRNIRRDEDYIYDKIEDKENNIYSNFHNNNNKNNELKNYYSYFEKTEWSWKYDFIIDKKPKSLDIPNTQNQFVYYPNTIDFEYLDSNQRRYDIYYKKEQKEKAKREIELKNNRPYEIDGFMENLDLFKGLFENNKSKLQNLVSLFMSKYQDWNLEKSNEHYESFAIFVKITLEKNFWKNNEIAKIFGYDDFESLKNDKNNDNIVEWVKTFFDLFDFVHRGLKRKVAEKQDK